MAAKLGKTVYIINYCTSLSHIRYQKQKIILMEEITIRVFWGQHNFFPERALKGRFMCGFSSSFRIYHVQNKRTQCSIMVFNEKLIFGD